MDSGDGVVAHEYSSRVTRVRHKDKRDMQITLGIDEVCILIIVLGNVLILLRR